MSLIKKIRYYVPNRYTFLISLTNYGTASESFEIILLLWQSSPNGALFKYAKGDTEKQYLCNQRRIRSRRALARYAYTL